MHWRSCLPLSFVAFLTLVSGCGRSTGDVTGRVTFADRFGKVRTVASGSVMLIGADAVPCYGEIQTDGSFTMTGVPVGPATATVTSSNPSGSTKGGKLRRADPETGAGIAVGSARSTQAAAADLHNWFRIPERYADPETSRLSLTVQRGLNNFDIVLEEKSSK